MLATLRPCPECQRHVRYSETACPFCKTALAKQTPRELPDVSRLSRAARVALGAALAVACAGDPKPEPVAPVYGAPAPVEPGPEPQPIEPVTDGGGGQSSTD